MMQLAATFSDDQIALLGCAAALVTTGTLMSLSYFLGRAFRQNEEHRPTPGTLKMPLPTTSPAAEQRKRAA